MANQFMFANFFATELIASVGVGDTILNIPPTAALKLQNFTSGFFAPMSLWDGSNPPEIVYITQNPQTGQLTCVRAQEGTSAFGWSAGTQLISSLSAGVINAALASYNSGQVLIANYLPLSGGTLFGPLIVGAPTQPQNPATKAYVDALGAGPFLPLTGGTLTGNLGMSNNGRITGLLTPSIGTEPATKTYTDAISTSLTNFMADRSGILVTAGTGAAYTLTTNQGYGGGLVDGVHLAFRISATNQTAPTLAVDGTAPVAIRAQSAVALPPGRLVVGSIWEVEYRASVPEWILVGERQQNFVTTSGGTTAYGATSGSSLSTLQDGLELSLIINVANTGATTLNVDTTGATPMRPASGIEFGPNALPQYSLLRVRYNAATVEWLVQGAPGQAISTQSLAFQDITNLQLTASVNANILTVAVKTAAGADPSPASPINIAFPDSTLSNGDPVWRQIIAALSINTNAVGASLGSSNTTPFRFWICAFDNAGTIALALINCSTQPGATTQIYPLNEVATQNTVAMSASATSAGVFYTPNGTTLTGKSFRILGYLEYNAGVTTAGTYNITPTAVRLFGHGVKKPGDSIQKTAMTSTTSITATSGTKVTTSTAVTITPTSTINPVRVSASGYLKGPLGVNTTTHGHAQIGRNASTTLIGNTVNVLSLTNSGGNNSQAEVGATMSMTAFDNPQTVSATTYTVYIWSNTSTTTWLGTEDSAVQQSYMEAEEIMG